jgi:DNA-binding transcriptional regulator YiaG
MTEATQPGVSPLAELVRAAQLPEPAERRRIREAAGVSLDRLGAELGVTGMTVSNWERGVFEPSLENAAAYRRLLDELTRAVA